jgi:S1-C subfamily serine protease
VEAPPADAQPSPVGLNQIRYAIPTGTPTMGVSARSLRCPFVMRKVSQGISARSFVDDNYKRLFRDALGAQGYDITGDPGRMFDEEEDMQRTVYAVGARVIDIKMDICQEQSLLFGYGLGYVGEAMVEVEWSVYDMLRRHNVYKTATKGYTELTAPNDEGIELLLENAFSAAVHNLGADAAFRDLVFSGVEPADRPGTYQDPEEDAIGLFDPREAVELPQRKAYDAPAAGRMDDLRKPVVMIQTAGGHGSGFFVTPQGHIVTNAHVVGHAKRARVTVSGKKKAFLAEVLRADSKRDVALLRLENMPPDLAVATFPVRADKPAVGEDVYAVGAPARRSLQDTVTKGIVSAHRYDRRRKQWLIQSDVYIYGGNSGGPLLDARGNLVGVTVAGYVANAGDIGGLNLFIPIHDALEALAVGGLESVPSVPGQNENEPVSLVP